VKDSGVGTAIHTVDHPRLPAVNSANFSESDVRRSDSNDGRVEFTGCLHRPEGDVKDAATAGPRVPRLAEAREQPGGDHQPLGRELSRADAGFAFPDV